MPSENEIEADLREMLRLYALLRNRNGYDELEAGDTAAVQPATSDEKLEEARRRRLHEKIERNPKLAREAKKLHGYACRVCEFDFGEEYGSLGGHFIIAHNNTPLAKLAAAGKVSLSPKDDFEVVCANCHAMIHAKGAPEKFEDFVALYRELLHPGRRETANAVTLGATSSWAAPMRRRCVAATTAP